MELSSCLYETIIMHHRLSPKVHRFEYKFFSFYLDLDEIDELTNRNRFFSRNSWNVYSLYDRDHVEFDGRTVKENILQFLNQKGISIDGGRIMLLTNLRTFGYVFNPVSLYFCFDKNNSPVCVIPEIGNTFGELKLFVIKNDHLRAGRFRDRQIKEYYISPFTLLTDQLEFRLTIPDGKLNIVINTVRNSEKIIITTMTGHRLALNNRNLLSVTLRFPLVTLKVISLIHWHAFLLWMKRVPFEQKTADSHLQKEVHRAWTKDAFKK